MNNKGVWALVGSILSLLPLGVLLIPVMDSTGMVQIANGAGTGVLAVIWIPTAAAFFAFYKALKSND